MQYIRINPDYKIETNFWVLNPLVALVSPFSKLYDLDDGGSTSSNFMWACYFNNFPDESKNFLFRLSPKERKKAISRKYPNFDHENALYLECNEAFPFACMNTIQRSLKEELESLKIRTKKLVETPYTFDHYMVNDKGEYIVDKGGKPILLKGSAKDIDAARAKTEKIYEGVEKALNKFMEQSESDARVFGGRKQTPSEKGLL